MRASPPAVAGVVPAAFVGMLRSRLIPAFLCVALVHVMLLAIFVAANRTPVQRAVQSTAIVAQLLRSQADTAAVAMQSRHEPTPARARPEPDRPHVSAAPQRAARQHAPSTPPVPVNPHSNSIAPGPAPVQAPAQTSPTALNVSSAAPRTAAGPANPSAAAQGATDSRSTPETIEIAAPKRVNHADCHIVKPAYPELSKRRDETGTATVRFVIGTTGAIDTVTLVKSSGFARLDDAAVQALRESACQPYVENGVPIRASYVQAFTFGLDDD